MIKFILIRWKIWLIYFEIKFTAKNFVKYLTLGIFTGSRSCNVDCRWLGSLSELGNWCLGGRSRTRTPLSLDPHFNRGCLIIIITTGSSIILLYKLKFFLNNLKPGSKMKLLPVLVGLSRGSDGVSSIEMSRSEFPNSRECGLVHGVAGQITDDFELG